MRIKRTYVINRRIWTVKICKVIPLGYRKTEPPAVMGVCDDDLSTIFIRKGMSELDTLETLVHELIHALEFSYGFKIPHIVIDTIDGPIAKAILANRRRRHRPRPTRACA